MQFPQNQKPEDNVDRSLIYILSLGTLFLEGSTVVFRREPTKVSS